TVITLRTTLMTLGLDLNPLVTVLRRALNESPVRAGVIICAREDRTAQHERGHDHRPAYPSQDGPSSRPPMASIARPVGDESELTIVARIGCTSGRSGEMTDSPFGAVAVTAETSRQTST